MATTKEKWQEIANRGLQDRFDPDTRAKFDEAVRRGLITLAQQAQEPAPAPEPTFGEQAVGALENVANIASSAALTIPSGLAGVAQAINPFADAGAGAQAVKDVQGLAFQPETEQGKAQQQALAEGVGAVGDFVNKNILAPNIALAPFVGKGGASGLFEGESASDIFKKIEQGGMSAAGNEVLKVTGSPLLATLTEILPTASAELVGGTQILRAAKAPAKAARKVLSDEIASGNINAGSIAKTLDAKGELIDNPKLKTAIKLMGDSDEAYSLAINFEKMNTATRVQVNKILDSLEANKKSLDPVDITENRPINVIGESIAKRVEKLDSIKRKASKRIGDLINGELGSKTVNISSARNDFIAALRESDVDVGQVDGELVADTANSLTNIDEVIKGKKLNNILNRLSKPNMTAKEAHRIKRNIRELVSYDPSKPGAVKASAEIEDAIKKLSSSLGDSVSRIDNRYKIANQHMSESLDALKQADKMLGNNLMIGEKLSEAKFGALSKRIATNISTKESVYKLLDSVDGALAKRGIRPKDDIKRQVMAVADIEKIFKLEPAQAAFGLQSRVGQAATEAAITGGVPLREGIGAVLDKFRGMSELEFKDKMKALRALSKVKDKK
ncbi:hypothetical protein [Pseudoalteromonas sp.]|uniref:hypothetical protein n=1 Tax=Pseudoalteromonas sp. TaxID=53249 RepID=UPI00356B4331